MEEKGLTTLNVTGVSKLNIKPDTVCLSIVLVGKEKTLDAAKASLNEDLKQLIDIVLKHGLSLKDIKTNESSFYPVHSLDKSKKKPDIIGYNYYQKLEIVYPLSLNITSKLISEPIPGRMTVSFLVLDKKPYQKELLSLACQNAYDRANAIVEAFNLKIDHISSIDDNNSYPWRAPSVDILSSNNNEMTEQSINFEPKDEIIECSVTVNFVLKDKGLI